MHCADQTSPNCALSGTVGPSSTKPWTCSSGIYLILLRKVDTTSACYSHCRYGSLGYTLYQIPLRPKLPLREHSGKTAPPILYTFICFDTLLSNPSIFRVVPDGKVRVRT